MHDIMSAVSEIADVERVQNSGRGICCVRSILACLHKGNVRVAKAVIWNEFDKIRNYPAVVAVLRKHGLTQEVDELHERTAKFCREGGAVSE